MRVVAWWLVATASAGDAELAVERGRVAYEREAYDDARNLAVQALAASPTLADAQRLYMDAAAAAGLGDRAVADLSGMTAAPPPYAEALGRVREAVAAADAKQVKTETKAALAAPPAPDVLQPLWTSEDPKIVKIRASVVDAWTDSDALQAADVQTLLATSRVLRAAGEDEGRAAVDAMLVAHGEPVAPARPPRDRVERTELARTLSKGPLTALPEGVPSELVDIITRLDETWTKAGKHRDVAAAWSLVQQVSDDSAAWTGEAMALLRAGDLDAAAEAANAAVQHAAGPRAVDVGASNTDRQRHELATAFVTRARVDEARGLLLDSTVDLATAHLLAGKVLDDKLGERIETGSAALQRSISGKWTVKKGTLSEAALSAASTTADATARRAIVYEALFLAAGSSDGTTALSRTPEPYTDIWGRAWLIAAAGDETAGNVEIARTEAVLGTLISGTALQPRGWARRGALHQSAGEKDAAFVALAVARGHGVTGLDAALQATYIGPGNWTRAADLVGGAPPATAAADETPAATKPAGTTKRSGLSPGSPFPAFSLSSPYGTISNGSLKGKVYVVSFFDASCAECLQMLPALGRMARTLRDEGRDVVVIGVSTDEDKAAFDDVYRVGEHWAQLVHAPALGVKVGVQRLPTTWVVDGDGVARYGVDHRLPTAAIEAQVRELAH